MESTPIHQQGGNGNDSNMTKMVVGETSLVPVVKLRNVIVLPESSGTKNKKRIIDGPLEVVVERRQRRMIKNRESAARSRARETGTLYLDFPFRLKIYFIEVICDYVKLIHKAYTVELEAELNQLEDENTKLKQTVAGIEQRRKQEVMGRKQSTRAPELAAKLRTMRRTVSG
ncbi:hypothetical protein M0R45_000743 [Rubus argutus]|uniref:BZIP domain-containing protein n=1 Tax=Rubus argutus TaxID=59490 RepID=A0AAW1VRZ4_RUBAR